MIHYTREGYPVKTGFNFTVSWDWRRFWFKVVYAQFDAATNNLTTWRLRFRSFLYPFILTGKHTYNVVDHYHWDRDLLPMAREILEDYPNLRSYSPEKITAIGGPHPLDGYLVYPGVR